VASYRAKYATKSTEAVGPVAVRITHGNLHAYASPFTHHGRLIRAAWTLGHHPHQDFQALRRWAHMLGFRGHFATKSRRYSTTLRALRATPYPPLHLGEHLRAEGPQQDHSRPWETPARPAHP
jgi:hypothetical protein